MRWPQATASSERRPPRTALSARCVCCCETPTAADRSKRPFRVLLRLPVGSDASLKPRSGSWGASAAAMVPAASATPSAVPMAQWVTPPIVSRWRREFDPSHGRSFRSGAKNGCYSGKAAKSHPTTEPTGSGGQGTPAGCLRLVTTRYAGGETSQVTGNSQVLRSTQERAVASQASMGWRES